MTYDPFNHAWDSVIELPEANRIAKPRRTGVTMVIDKGLGLAATKDLLELAGEHIDFIKIAFGSSALYKTNLMQKKIQLVKDHGIHIYPGGTLFEIAAFQGRVGEFCSRAKRLGFTYVEVSEGTIDLTPELRADYIKQCLDCGFGVLSEIGKKDRSIHLEAQATVAQIAMDLENGAEKVIIEGRDSGAGVGIYDEHGHVKVDLLNAILRGIPDINQIIIEAPQTSQHNYLLNKIGPNVNLGNVQPQDVLTLESTRSGLRGDTLRKLVLTQRELFK